LVIQVLRACKAFKVYKGNRVFPECKEIKDQLVIQVLRAYRVSRAYRGTKAFLECKEIKDRLVIQVHKVLEDLLETKV
jgi:hypothetical protein